MLQRITVSTLEAKTISVFLIFHRQKQKSLQQAKIVYESPYFNAIFRYHKLK